MDWKRAIENATPPQLAALLEIGMDDLEQCPTCEAEQDRQDCLLGTLGQLDHFRCRFCGMMWSREREAVTPHLSPQPRHYGERYDGDMFGAD